MVFLLENLSISGPARRGAAIWGSVYTKRKTAYRSVDCAKSRTKRLSANPERELPIIETTEPMVIIEKSFVQSLFLSSMLSLTKTITQFMLLYHPSTYVSTEPESGGRRFNDLV